MRRVALTFIGCLAVACSGSDTLVRADAGDAFAQVASETHNGYDVTILRHLKTKRCLVIVSWGSAWPSSPKSLAVASVEYDVCGDGR